MNYKKVAKNHLVSALDARIGDLKASIERINALPCLSVSHLALPDRLEVLKALEGYRDMIKDLIESDMKGHGREIVEFADYTAQDTLSQYVTICNKDVKDWEVT